VFWSISVLSIVTISILNMRMKSYRNNRSNAKHLLIYYGLSYLTLSLVKVYKLFNHDYNTNVCLRYLVTFRDWYSFQVLEKCSHRI